MPGKQRTTKHGPAQPDTRAQSKAAGNAAGGGDAETKDKSGECQQTRWVQHGAWRGGETYWLFTKSMALLVNMEAGAPLSFNCETESSISPPSARLESLFIADAMNTNANRTRPNVAVAPIVPARGTARGE